MKVYNKSKELVTNQSEQEKEGNKNQGIASSSIISTTVISNSLSIKLLIYLFLFPKFILANLHSLS